MCGSTSFQSRFSKTGVDQKKYNLVTCDACNLLQTQPKPTDAELAALYQNQYFHKRTDRGYDNYLSDSVRNELHRVWNLNLEDLGFPGIEKRMFADGRNRCLDVGCAAGYFVDFMNRKGWQAEGIEIGEEVARFGIEQLGLKITIADFMNYKFEQGFDLVTLWASIEHLRSPSRALRSISKMLKPGGILILSTCRRTLITDLLGPNWRFLNVPEHLFYFTLEQLRGLASKYYLKERTHISYGSGLTSKKDADFFYKTAKNLADSTVKLIDQGDMMAVLYEKESD